MTEQHKSFPEFYVTAPMTCPYLDGRHERKLFTQLTREKSPAFIDELLRNGFRRSQNTAYMPYCDGCNSCVSVRVVAGLFEPGRSFRRIADRNRDLSASRSKARPTAEQYELFRSYIDARHGDGGMADMTVLDFAMMVEETIIDTFVTEYRQRPENSHDTDSTSWPLAAVSLCDRLSDGVSMVYSFYDPALDPRRSLGTYMILDHIAYAQSLGLPYVYLGYWIDGSRKMSYKRRFEPLEQLTRHGWVAAPPRVGPSVA
jgi:arginine-tRNA-protein transferase